MPWFYKDGDRKIGPISRDELMNLIRRKQITRKTLVRNTKMHEWLTLDELMRIKSQGMNKQPGRSASSKTPEMPAPKKDEPRETPSTTAVPLEKEIPFQFKGTGPEYFKVWIVNVLLSFLTLGIYSAWAKVRRKQYFYGNTSVAGAAFRYLADPLKILKGRCIVFLGFVGYSVINHFFPIAASILSVGLIFILPWLVVRSLAFNARNSAWRNIRFNFTGTYKDAGEAYLLYSILIPFTLGMIVPYVLFLQKKFVVENSAYGTNTFSFHATSKDYYRIVLKLLFLLIISGLILGSVIYLFPKLLLISAFAIVAMYLYAFAYFSVKSGNLLYNSSTLLKHNFKATMRVIPFLKIVAVNTIATVLTAGLFYPFAVVRSYRYKLEHLFLLPEGDLGQFVAAELKETSALGDEISDFMDFDFGL